MPPAVIDAMASFRAAIDANDVAQSQRMARAWLEVSRGLDAEFQAVSREVANAAAVGRGATIWHVSRMERFQSLMVQIITAQRRFATVAATDITETQALMARWSVAQNSQLIAMQRPAVAGQFDRLPVEAVINMVGHVGDGTPLGDYLRTSFGTEGVRAGNVLVRGTALGWHPTKTARAMRDEVNVTLGQAITVARTEQMRVWRETGRQQYIESKVVEGYRRVASKSIRTCMACLMADGQVYPLSEPFEEHVNGRCTCIPVIFGAPPVSYETGEQWFLRQDAATQRRMMGPGRFEAWQQGRFGLPDLITVQDNATWGKSLQVTPLYVLAARPAANAPRPVPPAPVTASPPPPLIPSTPQWRPSMSRQDAELWAQGSQYLADVTHTTQGDANARSIMANGFDLSRSKFGRVWGNGVYVAVDQETTDMYRNWSSRSGNPRTLKAKINVSNMFVYEPTQQNDDWADIISAALGVSRADAVRRLGSASLDEVLSDAGYDAFHLKAYVSIFGGGPGGNQIVIFDPRKVVIIDEP